MSTPSFNTVLALFSADAVRKQSNELSWKLPPTLLDQLRSGGSTLFEVALSQLSLHHPEEYLEEHKYLQVGASIAQPGFRASESELILYIAVLEERPEDTPGLLWCEVVNPIWLPINEASLVNDTITVRILDPSGENYDVTEDGVDFFCLLQFRKKNV